MGFRNRFFTPKTAQAILSWRLLLGAVVGIGLGLLIGGAPGLTAGLAGGIAVYGGSVVAAMPRTPRPRRIDPFTLSEPWRQMVQQGQRAGRRLRDTVDGVADGPLKQRLQGIAVELERGLAEGYAVAQRGHQLDAAYNRLDPVGLRSRLATLEGQAGSAPTPEQAAAIESVRTQLAGAARVKEQSQQTADRLRLTSTRLDELVARAAEVAVGTAEPDTYARDVDSLVEQIEALHLAVEETNS
ncbi:MAG TPA: hypothetical protein VNQ73_06770 [Ilumatobacter sp.]|nr:hypothetical protein [Ilumatobacter sp.]